MKPMNLDEILRDWEMGEELLVAHINDIKLHGAARPQAQCEFTRIAYGALEEACEQRRELAVEVKRLRGEANDAGDDAERIEDALSQIAAYDGALHQVAGESLIQYVVEDVLIRLREAEEAVIESREPMPCGHPRACLAPAGLTEGTMRCAWCADLARCRGLLGVAADNAEGFREMLVVCEREMAELKAELGLMKGKAGSRGGRL